MSESKAMPSIKRFHDGSEKDKEQSSSPFMPMFEGFRDELDEHHDRRERIIKTSRDITAASKKMYSLYSNHIELSADSWQYFRTSKVSRVPIL
jgi:hypothetical protein